MEGIVILIVLLALMPLMMVIRQFPVRTKFSDRAVILLNLLVWAYEVFFLFAVCGGLPHAAVHFGGGLGDLLFFFILIGMIIVHMIVLSVMAYKTRRASWFLLPLALAVFLLNEMHLTAARGNMSNNYMTGGNFTGLYYDREAIHQRQERQREREEAAKPKKPEFADPFESALYDAEQGDAVSQNHVAVCYMTGDGVAKNDTLGVMWFRKAAENGLYCSEGNLGYCYAKGLGGLKVDHAEAARWFRKAAEQGVESAQYELGRYYGNGQGVEKDEEEAYKWLRMAARNEHKGAQELLKLNGQTW